MAGIIGLENISENYNLFEDQSIDQLARWACSSFGIHSIDGEVGIWNFT